jgi:hypothetical protein
MNKSLIEEEANDVEGSQDEVSPPTKRRRTEAMVLDDDETAIASGLRPIPTQFEEDETGSQDGDAGASDAGGDAGVDSEQGGGALSNTDDLGDDGHGNGFEDNGVCSNLFTRHLCAYFCKF